MAQPSSTQRAAQGSCGGKVDDYLAIHNWFDESKPSLADFRHRALRHHAEGIFLAEKLFGFAIVNSDGNQVPIRHLGEQHVREDSGAFPRSKIGSGIKPQRWMYGQGRAEETPSGEGWTLWTAQTVMHRKIMPPAPKKCRTQNIQSLDI